MNALARQVRRFFERRRRRRVADDLSRILFMLEHSPELRKHLRKVLRVKGYEPNT